MWKGSKWCLAIALFVMGFLPASQSLVAHHNWNVDRSRTVTVMGIVTSFSFSNPHVQVYFDVADDAGNVAKWSAGGSSPNRLSRSGWTRETFKAGDEIIVTGHRARDGSNVMRFESIAFSDGKPVGGYVGGR
jgi:hypothetical protein